MIRAWKPLFEEYEELDRLPIYAWGRYYKYESSGEEMECYIDEAGWRRFKYLGIKDIDWKLIQKIEDKYNQRGGKIWTGEIGDYLPNREEMAKDYNFDSRGGKCLVIVRTDKGVYIACEDCSTPE